MVSFPQKEHYDLADFRQVIEILRHPGGCPWDQEQTHQSIRRNLLEEAYEAAEAIDTENTTLLQEELGDVLMQVLFHSSIEADAGRFDLDDVADMAVKKLIFRHPHVFGSVDVADSSEVLVNWDALKRQEKHQESYTDTLDAVARSLPALWRAEKVQKKASKAHFDWDNVNQTLDKVHEELGDLEDAIAEGSLEHPEDALNAATEKFIRRFRQVEQLSQAQGQAKDACSVDELVALWKDAKHTLDDTNP